MRPLIVFAVLAALCGHAEARTHHGRSYAHHGASQGWPSAWCGAWLSQQVFGRTIRSLWLARNWAGVGHRTAGPAPGVIGVMPHHVFKVLAVVGAGRVLAISGNDGHRVRTRVRSTHNVIAWRAI